MPHLCQLQVRHSIVLYELNYLWAAHWPALLIAADLSQSAETVQLSQAVD
jgi:hypothetical protein